MSGFFSTTKQAARRAFPVNQKEITIRDFTGGWNVVDNDQSLNVRYAKKSKNLFREQDGSLVLRFGSQFLCDLSSVVSGSLIDIHYFNNHLIAVMSSGEIAAVNENWVPVAIWNASIAATRPGSPAPWSDDFHTVDFVDFRTDLIIHNGVDKPLIIDDDILVNYLQDPATGSNVFTPIGAYGCTVADYHVIAGITGEPNTIYISSKGTSGVFQGDAPPNDGISFDVGSLTNIESDIIHGVAGLGRQLLVFYHGSTVVLTLGAYDADQAHVPQFEDTIARYGAISHRVLTHIENDILYGDVIGANTAKRNVFTTAVESERLSSLIAPAWQRNLASLDHFLQHTQVFAVYDRLAGHWMAFAPDGQVFVYVFDQAKKTRAWCEFEFSEPWTCACGTYLGRVVLGEGTKLFMMGNRAFEGEQYSADRLLDRDGDWAPSTSYSAGDLVYDPLEDLVYECKEPHTSGAGSFAFDRAEIAGAWEEYLGQEIEFEYESPWLEQRQRMKLKKLSYIMLDTLGTAKFHLKLFIDGLFRDKFGDQIYQPAVDIEFTAGSSGGYGEEPEQGFGGGRRTLDMRLWKSPTRFKTIKFIISGATKRPLQFVALSMMYATGGTRRGF